MISIEYFKAIQAHGGRGARGHVTAAVEVELSHGLAHAQGHAILPAPSALETVKTADRAFLVIINAY